MNGSKSFHLRWNNHLQNLRSLLELLYNEQSFVDVTLSCSDGFIRAHKLVLSACSPYFDTIFRENPCKHPTVILKGVSLREMQLIIEYMYAGSVDVPEEELHTLLNVASDLHIKGLVRTKTEDSEEMSQSSLNGNDTFYSNSIKTESSEDIAPTYEEEDFGSSVKKIDNVPSLQPRNTDINGDEEMICNAIGIAQVNMEESETGQRRINGNASYNQQHSFNIAVQANIPAEDDIEMYCKICNRTFTNRQNMKRHMQTHSGEKPHRCNFCSLSFLRLSHLQRHHRVHTGERPFACNHCDKQFSRSDKLKQHVAMHHSGYAPPPKESKQRGRPRKGANGTLDDFATVGSDQQNEISIDDKAYAPNMENNVPSFQTLQQVYNIQPPLKEVSIEW